METIISRYVVLPVVLVLLTFSSAAFAAGGGGAKAKPAPTTIVSKVITSGETVDVSWQDDLSFGGLQAVDDSTNGVATALLTYAGVYNEPASQICTSDPLLGTYCYYTRVTYDTLTANINPNDLTVTANSARLDTELLMATNVNYSRCTYDMATNITDCTSVPPAGQISLQWRKTSTDYAKFFGKTETKTGPQIVRKVGSSQSYSALASGSLLGTPLLKKSGHLGTNRGVTVDILMAP